MPTVLLTAPYMIPFRERFQPVFDYYGLEVLVPAVEERMEAADLLAYAGQFDGTICGDDRYTPEVIQACLPRLKVISKWGTGIDSIDKAFANANGVLVGNTPNAFTIPVADTILGYMLAFARRQPWMDAAMKRGEWQKIAGHSLGECTLGVVGVGNIGKAALRRAQAFGMTLLGTDIIDIDPAFVAEVGVEMTSLENLLAGADFVALTCDLNPTSRHIVNAETLAQMKPGAVVINAARGPLVDEPALIAALQSSHLGGAALDVFEYEPLPKDSPLLTMDNVMLAPHNANSSPRAWEAVHWNSIRNLLQGLDIPHPDLDTWVNQK